MDHVVAVNCRSCDMHWRIRCSDPPPSEKCAAPLDLVSQSSASRNQRIGGIISVPVAALSAIAATPSSATARLNACRHQMDVTGRLRRSIISGTCLTGGQVGWQEVPKPALRQIHPAWSSRIGPKKVSKASRNRISASCIGIGRPRSTRLVTPCARTPQGTIPEKCSRSGSTLMASP